MATTTAHHGSCNCGAITFSFTGPLDDVWFCHCVTCRKNYGMYGAFVGAPRNAFSLDTNAQLQSHQSSGKITRTFCGMCGSPVTWDHCDLDRVYVLLGLLDEEAKIESAQHIFTKDKGAYYEICDHWPQHKTVPE